MNKVDCQPSYYELCSMLDVLELTKPRVAGIILAAGKGTRMRSVTPKVLHRLAGLSMLDWVFRATKTAGVNDICVILSDELSGFQPFLDQHQELTIAIQANRQGTGDAVASAALAFDHIKPPTFAAGRLLQGPKIAATHLLILAGDIPAIDPPSLKAFVDAALAANAPLSVLGMDTPSPSGYGRLLTRGNELVEIVEEKDADAATKQLRVVNTGVIFAETKLLFDLLTELKPDNAQKEYYLTDTVRLCRQRGMATRFHVASDWQNFAGINDRVQLAAVEDLIVQRLWRRSMLAGVTVHSPGSSYIEADVEIGQDSIIGAGAKLCGHTILGPHCRLEPNVVLQDVKVAAGVVIGAGSVLKNCGLKQDEVVPPLSVRNGL